MTTRSAEKGIPVPFSARRRKRSGPDASRCPASVSTTDDAGWSPYKAQRSQPVATAGKWEDAENGSNRLITLPSLRPVRPNRPDHPDGAVPRLMQPASAEARASPTAVTPRGAVYASARVVMDSRAVVATARYIAVLVAIDQITSEMMAGKNA